ncbi:DAGAT-domain-containing protein [Lophium mytilinum]|uniref:diacylglycerol O-acyltransferase n=1 Tax=Lophium mytilinum TaxID=390894 RepID=A0A6A6R3W1_9PEZI|nr:DAGAT-domain-containing protein [Lophium mytilinum]
MSLNPEPAAPKEREAQHLAPKSYAEATEAPADSQINHRPAKENSGAPEAATTTNGLAERPNGASQSTKRAKPTPAPIEPEKEQYEGSGQDDSPKSPTRKGHKRHSSLKSNGSVSTSSRPSSRSQHYIYHEHKNGNGGLLASIEPSEDYNRQLRVAKKEKPAKKGELVHGRKAGAGWTASKIRYAPLNVPLQRRLQTLVVLMHTLSVAGLLAIFFLACGVPLLWPIVLPYSLYVLFSHAGTDGKLSHRSERWRRSSIWSLFASYYPARLHRSAELPPTRKYIFGYHPHGIISHGAWAAFATEALGFSQLFPGITNTLLTLDANFRIPLYREYALRMGLASVSRESCEALLTHGGPNGEGMGRAITIVVGGARESLDARPGTFRLVLKRRKGFVKIAIRTGADLVPVLGFGENDIYDQVDAKTHPWVHKFQLLVKKIMGFTVPLFHARGIFNYDVGMMPYRRPLNVVVGHPIKVMQQEQPDREYVESLHAQYVEELERMWNEWRDTFAPARTEELKMVE